MKQKCECCGVEWDTIPMKSDPEHYYCPICRGQPWLASKPKKVKGGKHNGKNKG